MAPPTRSTSAKNEDGKDGDSPPPWLQKLLDTQETRCNALQEQMDLLRDELRSLHQHSPKNEATAIR